VAKREKAINHMMKRTRSMGKAQKAHLNGASKARAKSVLMEASMIP
jgi:hypothetical protein